MGSFRSTTPWIDQKRPPKINQATKVRRSLQLEKHGVSNGYQKHCSVLYYEKEHQHPKQSEHNIARRKQVNLLLITDSTKTHYTTIKNLLRLSGNETSKNHNAMDFCLNCLYAFNTIELRDKQYEYCIDHDAVKVAMSKEN